MNQLQIVRNFLHTANTLVLSTVSPAGEAHSAPLFYLPDEHSCDLYWLSSLTAAHSAHLKSNAACAASVFRSTDQWREITGVQLKGNATLAPTALREPIVHRYIQRFHLSEVHSSAIQRSALYVFHPHWARYLDNSQAFGYNFELTL